MSNESRSPRFLGRILEDHERLSWLMRGISTPDVVAVTPANEPAARRAVRELNNLAGETLAAWIVGDAGCGIRLTERGRRLCVGLQALMAEQNRLLSQFGAHFIEDLRLLDRVAVRTSARNQIVARVNSLAKDKLRGEVVLELAGNHLIRAAITDNSATALGLKPGCDVIVLIKASSVTVAFNAHGACYRGFNKLNGKIIEIIRCDDNVEVIVEIGLGVTMVALATESWRGEFTVGAPVTVVFDPATVLIGVAD